MALSKQAKKQLAQRVKKAAAVSRNRRGLKKAAAVRKRGLQKVAAETQLPVSKVAEVLEKSAALGMSMARAGKSIGEMNPYLSSALLGSGVGALGGAGYGAVTGDEGDRILAALRGAGAGAAGGAAGGAGSYGLARLLSKLRGVPAVHQAVGKRDLINAGASGRINTIHDLSNHTLKERLLARLGDLSESAGRYDPGASLGGALLNKGRKVSRLGQEAGERVARRPEILPGLEEYRDAIDRSIKGVGGGAADRIRSAVM
jgi:hypothetical protein